MKTNQSVARKEEGSVGRNHKGQAVDREMRRWCCLICSRSNQCYLGCKQHLLNEEVDGKKDTAACGLRPTQEPKVVERLGPIILRSETVISGRNSCL